MLTRRAWLTAVTAAALTAQPRRPNIIVIVADDLGSADLGFTGAADIPTPHLDALARSGLHCINGYVSHPFCSPTRAGLLTGRYQQRFGHENNPRYDRTDTTAGLPLSEITLPQTLSAAGYRTGVVGKWHLGATPAMHPMKRGFREMYGFLGGGHDYFEQQMEGDPREYLIPIERDGKPEKFDGYLTPALSREAAAFVQRAKPGEPFFLYLAYNAPHTPVQVPQSYEDRLQHISDSARRRYAAMIVALDDGIGLLTRTLQTKDLTNNTLVFFFSDNGGPTEVTRCSNAPLRGHKGQVYEGGIRVPFIVSWPTRIKAGRFDPMVSSLDVFATACAAAAVPVPPNRDSVNLFPYFDRSVKGNPHLRLFWRTGGGAAWASREGDWKLVRHRDQPLELYDLKADPAESRNIYSDHKFEADQMWTRLAAWDKELIPPRFQSPRPAAKKQKKKPA
jgi:arylsulfatase A-like enzyme